MTTPSADSMMAEIQSESLQSLLTSVRSKTSPPGSTHIPALDAHLFSAGKYHASTISSLNGGDVVEIQGPPASGKTHLLYHIIITAILPTDYLGEKLGGWSKAAVVFDTDGTFDIQRLHRLLHSRISRLISVESTEDLARASLKKLHIFRPTSSIQLATSLINLPAYHTDHLPDLEIGLVAVDSISSFYWPDRFTVEQMNSGQNEKERSAGPFHNVLLALQRIHVSHAPATVLTNWGLHPLTRPTRDSGPTTLYKQHLHPFPSLVNNINSYPNTANNDLEPSTSLSPLTHHITLPFVSIAPFESGISLDDAKEQESKYRKEIVTKGEFVGIIRTSGSTRVGRFTFAIGEDEVLVGGAT